MSEILLPRENPHLFGHLAAQSELLKAARSGRLHHAWLLTGPHGIGKATLAYRFARWLLAGAKEDGLALLPDHPTFRRVAAGTHADLLSIEREWDPKRKRQRGEILVEDVRRIADFLRLTAAEGGWRVVVVDGADALNRHAANALLKVLEEPPARTVLLLVANATGRILPTIRSRCRQLRLSPLREEEMEQALRSLLPEQSAEERKKLAILAEGSPGRAVLLFEGQGLELAELVDEVLSDLPRLDLARAYRVADALGAGENAFPVFMQLLRTRLARLVRNVASGKAGPHETEILGARALDDWAEVWHALGSLADEAEAFHLDQRQAIVNGLQLLSAR
jgi:DNA polymerase-3 subunit delta'